MKPELLGVHEAAELLGHKKSNFVQRVAVRPDFPAPVVRLRATPVWSREDLERFKKLHPRKVRR